MGIQRRRKRFSCQEVYKNVSILTNLNYLNVGESEYQELIQSRATPDPGHHMGKWRKTQENIMYKRTKR